MGWKAQTGLDLAESMIKELRKTKSNNIVFHSDVLTLSLEGSLKEFLDVVSQVRV